MPKPRSRNARKSFNISMVGDRKLQRKLASLRKVVQTPIVRDSMAHAMKPVQEMAQANAPVLTGRLKKSIKIGSFSAKGGVIGAAVRSGTRRQLRIEPSDPYYYPAALEYGTAKKPAKSFMRAAMFAKRGEVIARFRRNLKRILEK